MTISRSITGHRIAFGTWPTPLEPAPRLARAIGLRPQDLWIKRDDLVGLGGGGNKVRKLEWTVAEAVAAGADTLVTTGAPQSNHARLTAAAGARLGLRVVLVLAGRPDGSHAGNLALDGLFGAGVTWAGDDDLERVADAVVEQLREEGARPALIPFGGSSVTGARGYAEAARELLEQVGEVHTVVVAVGSGGTMAGLVSVLGCERVLGVDTGALDDPAPVVAALAGGLAGEPIAAERLRIVRDQVGAGYATLTEPVAHALELVARTEGIVLDPIYTGRAAAGLIAAVRSRDVSSYRPTVFLHTGGLPGFFGHPDAIERAESTLATYGLK